MNLLWEQRSHREGETLPPRFIPETGIAAGAPLTRCALQETRPQRAVGGKATTPCGSRASLPGRTLGSARAAEEVGAGGLPARILLLCGNFPLERPLRFLTRRLMEGAVERARVPGISSLVSKQARSR